MHPVALVRELFHKFGVYNTSFHHDPELRNTGVLKAKSTPLGSIKNVELSRESTYMKGYFIL